MTTRPKPVIEKIEYVRRERGLTQDDLQQAARLAGTRISKWIDGKGAPDYRQVRDIARALDVSLDWLCDDDAKLEDWTKREGLQPIERLILWQARRLGLNKAAKLLNVKLELVALERQGKREEQGEPAPPRTPEANVTVLPPPPPPPPPPKKPVQRVHKKTKKTKKPVQRVRKKTSRENDESS